jgi:prepilin-type N-terminal cleavage/methylation domain-containing protein/prepilin-type processing-associated H-X9-DG protein
VFIGHRGSRGFTLVELLVVIAIIGVLIALLLPAVQAARESARRVQCVNNMKQPGVALHNYENLNKSLPINWSTTGDGVGQSTVGHSWLTGLLPFLEEDVLYKSIKMGQPLSINLAPAAQSVAAFACPSDPQNGPLTNQDPLVALVGQTLGVTNYKACAGMNWPASADPLTSATSSTAIYSLQGRNCNKTDGADYGNGIICRGRRSGTMPPPLFVTSLRDIRDGLSKTFAIGEAVPSWSMFSAWYNYNGSYATCGVPLNFRIPGRPTTDPVNASDTNGSYNRSFMSYHRGGCNFCMCDGSVTFINNEIEYLLEDPTGYITVSSAKYLPGVYMRLATIDGGEFIDPNKLSP